MNAETVTNQDIPLNLGKQAVMEVAQTHNNSIVSISPNLKSDLGCFQTRAELLVISGQRAIALDL